MKGLKSFFDSKKTIWLLIFFILAFINFSSAENYIFYYGNWCSHCAKVEKYFEENATEQSFQIERKEVRSDRNNRDEFMGRFEELNIWMVDQWVPILLTFSGSENPTYLVWDTDIINYFQSVVGSWEKSESNFFAKIYRKFCNFSIWKINTWDWTHLNVNDKWFLLKLLPSALSDSVNPCVFTIMLLLLFSILSKTKSRKKAVLSWIMFALAIFITYLSLWILFAKWVSSFANSNTIFWIKIWSWILWLLVWLANLKDYFWYGKGFVMEVPFSRRPRMKKIIDKVTSPFGAFFVWMIVSLFIAPCSSWPYLPILAQIGASDLIGQSWGILLLVIYNTIFVLPILIIVWLVGLWIKKPEELAKVKNANTQRIHLFVWIFMLFLWIYLTLEALCIL